MGAIKRPGIYEADDNDNILDLVNYAAGLRSDADNKILVSFKYFSNEETILKKNIFHLIRVMSSPQKM